MTDVELPPLYHDLTYNAPLSTERARRLAAFLADDGDGHIVDVGCGWAELLLTALELAPRMVGTGIDVDADVLARARASAVARSLSHRLTLLEGPGAESSPRPVEAVISIGARHVWGDDAAALAALRSLVDRGGRVVYGDGIWRRPPTPEAVAQLGGNAAAYGTLADVVDTAVAAGFRVMDVAEASIEEWDAFESGYSAGYERWLVDHPDHPAADDVRGRSADHRSAYLRGYRGIWGLGYLQLIAT